MGLTLKETAFIGDDVNDLEVMTHVGLAACPSDAVNEVKSVCSIILSTKGGEGCIREFIDAYLQK
jgi:YrbI family 3-deoxy-D-manno-octulosonate 8-phosphate phosphatase